MTGLPRRAQRVVQTGSGHRAQDRARGEATLGVVTQVEHPALGAGDEHRQAGHLMAELFFVVDAFRWLLELPERLRGFRGARGGPFPGSDLSHRVERAPPRAVCSDAAVLGDLPLVDAADQKAGKHRPHGALSVRDEPERRGLRLDHAEEGRLG
jgi:hypothetical protein